MDNLVNTAIERDLVGQIASRALTTEFRLCDRVVTPDDFTDPACTVAWRAFRTCEQQGNPTTLTNTINAARLNGDDPAKLLADLMAMDTDNVADVVLYAAEVATLAAKRRLMRDLRNIAHQIGAHDYSIDDALSDLRTAIDNQHPQGPRTMTWSQLSVRVMKHAEDLMNGREDETLRCGISYIDSHGGLRPGDLNIIAGRTSNGKTALALTIVLNAAMLGTTSLVFSLEMSLDDISYRLAAMISGIPGNRIERTPLDQQEFNTLFTAINTAPAAGAPLLFDDRRSSDFNTVTATIRSAVRDSGVRLVVIDYLQLLRGSGERRAEAVGQMANQLKALAVETGVCIILLSQLARPEKGKTSMPRLNELKESGDIENAADNVWMVYRAELYNERYPDPFSDTSTEGTVMVDNPKSRKGAVGRFMMGFDPPTTRFFDRDSFETVERPANTYTPF